MVRRLREAGAIVVGLTLLPELAICGFTESATYGVTRNPWNPQRTPGRLERRLGRGGRRRPGPDRLGRRRRRLDPDPRRLLRPLRPEAVSAAGSRWRPTSKAGTGSPSNGCLSRTVLDTALWLDIVAGGSRGARARRRRPSAPSSRRRRRRPASCASPARPRRRAPPRRRSSPTTSSGAVADAAELLRSLGHEVAQRDPDWGGIGNNITARFLRGVADDGRRSAPPRAARTPHPRLRPPRRPAPRRRSTSGRCAAASADAARVNAIFDDLRRADHAGDGRHRAAGPPLGGPGRPAHRARDEPLLSLLRPLEPPRQPGDVGARRLRRRRHAALGPDHRPPRRRGDAALAGRPDRGRAALGGPAARRSVLGAR